MSQGQINLLEMRLREANTKITWLEAEIERLRKDAQRLYQLRILMGYVQDGSDETVILFQDDATRSFFVRAGNKTSHGPTLEQAIDNSKEK